MGKNAQRSHQINQGMDHQLGGAFANLFGGGINQPSYEQPMGVQQPMANVFSGLFNAPQNQNQSNIMHAFPFMMPPARAQPHYQPNPYARNQIAPVPPRAVPPPRAVNNQPPFIPQTGLPPPLLPQQSPQQPSSNPFQMLGAGNLNAEINKANAQGGQLNYNQQNKNYRR